MDPTVLSDAARHGKVDVLLNSVKDYPSILAEFRLASLGESLMHIATKAGQINFVRELMRIKPQMSHEVNKDGFRPLDIAVIMGNLGMVEEILSFNHHHGLLCIRLKGKNDTTALHYAASMGRIDVIDELMRTCNESIEDVTVNGETALHLAVKNHQFDAFDSLVEWLGMLDKKSMVNVGDGEGDTVLHLSVSTKQYTCVELLVGEKGTMKDVTEVNARNLKGLTALDILYKQDSYDTKTSRMLESAGAVRTPNSDQDWFKYFKFQKHRDSPSDTRNALLVVAALIATVCFQSGVTPPDGTFATSAKPLERNQTTNVFSAPPPHVPGAGVEFPKQAVSAGFSIFASIFGSHATSYLFLFSNSLGFAASTCIIIYLTSGFPFQRELHIAMYSMMFTYGFATSVIIKDLHSGQKNQGLYLFDSCFRSSICAEMATPMVEILRKRYHKYLIAKERRYHKYPIAKERVIQLCFCFILCFINTSKDQRLFVLENNR